MSNFLSLPDEATPLLTDKIFTGRGTSAGAERKPTLQAALSLLFAGGLTGVLPAGNGGTGNGFTAFSGPASSLKTFTLPNASATILTDNAVVTVAQGGTGRATSTTAYGLLATGTTATGAHQTLAAGLTTQILVGGGASALPVWTTATGSGSPVRGTSPTIADPTLSGTVSGTYTLGGTPTLSGTVAGTPTWSGANIWSAVGRFNGGLGVNGLPSSSAMDTTTLFYLSRTDATGSGVRLGSHYSYEAAFPNTVIATSGLFDIINTGTASGGGGHLLGVIGRAQDTATGALPMYGVEGKVIVKGTNDGNAAVWGIADYDGVSHTGRTRAVFSGFAEIFNGSLSSPVNQGTTVVYQAITGTGGDPTQRFALMGDSLMKVRTGGATHITMEHDGSDGKIAVNTGAIRLYAPGNFVVLQDAFGFVPFSNGSSLGIDGFRWKGTLTGDTNISLLSSVTPAVNGDLVFQATSNTSLTFKYKGSDGTVRSASVTLS